MWEVAEAYSFAVSGNNCGISAIDFLDVTIDPCILRILCPHMWANNDVHWASLDHRPYKHKKSWLTCYRKKNSKLKLEENFDQEAYHG